MTTQEIIEKLAFSAIGTPYVRGGNDPFNQTKWDGKMVGPGADCSGFVVWLLRSTGIIEMNKDMTANDMFSTWGHNLIDPGVCSFYGERDVATHVMVAIGRNLCIGSCGDAGVCVRPVHYRDDFLGFAAPRG